MKFLSSQVIKKQSRTVSLNQFSALADNPSPTLFWLFEFYGAIIIMSTAKLWPKRVDENSCSTITYFLNQAASVGIISLEYNS